MGQKVNPTCLRLHPENKHFDSCWFSEKRYADSIHKDLYIGTYYNGILKQIQYPSASNFLEASPRKCQIYLTFLNPRQLREQSFRQFGHTNVKNKKRKRNTLFSIRKKTTSLYGLLERERGSLGFSRPYFFTAPFLQGFKKKESPFSFSQSFLTKSKNTKKIPKTVEKREKRKKSEAITRVGDLMFSSFLQVEKRDSQNKAVHFALQNVRPSPTLLENNNHIIQLFTQFVSLSDRKSRMPFLFSKTETQAVSMQCILLRKMQTMEDLRLRKGTCSNMLSLAILQYFVQRNLSGNLLSTTSRFLLLQTLFSFFQKKKDWSHTFDEFSQQEREPLFPISHQVSGSFLTLSSFLRGQRERCLAKAEKKFVFLFSKKENTNNQTKNTRLSLGKKYQNHQKKREAGWSLVGQQESAVNTSILRATLPSISPSISHLHQTNRIPQTEHHAKVQIGAPFSSEKMTHNLSALPSGSNRFASQIGQQKKSPSKPSMQSMETTSIQRIEPSSMLCILQSKMHCKEITWGNHHLLHLRKSSLYTYHIESLISNKLKSSCKILLFRAQNVAQNALFIAEEIVYQLQRRNTFRQIKTKFLQELANKSAIKGVRVTCVGRIGGRAKKAQRARGESFKIGQTSLHLFDSKVSFASKTALTPYGAVGVKVWVCWK